ncbi:MAG: hypothetical protein ACE5LU_26225, partial [Anaerolineae bacterium]
MDTPVVGHMDADKFEAMVEHFIEHRSGEDDRLPAQTFFELLAEREATTEPVEVHVTWLETGPVITAPPNAPLTIEGHRIRFEDGHELILRFDWDEQE